jgi:hypothetical protein
MGVGGQLHTPAALPPGMTRYPLYRRLDRPQGWSGRVLKILPPPVFDPRTFQLVVSHYTDCAILAPRNINALVKLLIHYIYQQMVVPPQQDLLKQATVPSLLQIIMCLQRSLQRLIVLACRSGLPPHHYTSHSLILQSILGKSWCELTRFNHKKNIS